MATEQNPTDKKGERKWAPCFHGKDAKQERQKYIKGVLARINQPVPDGTDVGLEDLFWIIGLASYNATEDIEFRWAFYADQWVGISLEIIQPNHDTIRWWTEGDEFTIAMALMFERLLDAGLWPEAQVDDDLEISAPEVEG